MFSYGNAWPFLALWWPVVGGDTCSSLAPILGPEKKVAMSPSLKFTALGEEYDAKMFRLYRRYLWGGDFRQLVSTATPKQEKYRADPHEQYKRVTWPLFFQDLSMIGARVIAKTCPHRPQALEKAIMITLVSAYVGFCFFSFVFWTRRLQVLQGMADVCRRSIVRTSCQTRTATNCWQ